jgi:RNA polymerase sigma-70 factor (ECF subfamily)
MGEEMTTRAASQGGAAVAPHGRDEALVAAFLNKEPAAAETLYDRYASRIYGLGLVLLHDATDAEDLVQDAFVKMWRTAAVFDPERASLDAWVLLIARGLAIDLLRRRTLEAKRLAAERVDTEVSDEPSPESYAEHRDLMDRARTAMTTLPAKQRTAIELSYLNELSSTEVAELEGIPRGTAKSRVRAGIATLRHALTVGGAGRSAADGREERVDLVCG